MIAFGGSLHERSGIVDVLHYLRSLNCYSILSSLNLLGKPGIVSAMKLRNTTEQTRTVDTGAEFNWLKPMSDSKLRI
jgi:hypothetical protein